MQMVNYFDDFVVNWAWVNRRTYDTQTLVIQMFHYGTLFLIQKSTNYYGPFIGYHIHSESVCDLLSL